MNRKSAALLGAAFLLTAQLALGDTIRLSNGDTMSGKVTTFNEKEIVIKNDIIGEVKIPREKVVAIVLGDRAIPGNGDAAASGPPNASPNLKGKSPEQIVKELTNEKFDLKMLRELEGGKIGPPNQEDVLRELRKNGAPAGLKEQLMLKLPGFGAPEVQSYYNKQVNGLIDGSVTIDDIRDDAVKARDQLKELQEDLGPGGAALNGYLSILEGFIDETTPPKAKEEEANQEDPPANQ